MSFTRFIYLILIVSITWCSYYIFSSERNSDVQIAPNTELPMFSGNKLENTTYGDDGIRSYVIVANHLDYFAKSGSTLFEQPILFVYKGGEIVEWKVTSKTAVLDDDQVLTLYDDVLMHNLLPGASFDTMATDKMTINLNNRDFYANQKVILVGPQFENTGGAMHGNLNSHIATLTNDVQGRYETVTP